jgi:hypothetical protein
MHHQAMEEQEERVPNSITGCPVTYAGGGGGGGDSAWYQWGAGGSGGAGGTK